MSRDNGKVYEVALFLTGGLLGATIALLFAPQSGKKTRRDIIHWGKMAKNKSEQFQLQVTHAIDSLVEGVSEKVEESLDRGLEWTEKTASEFQEVLSTGKESIQREIEKILRVRA